MLEGVVGVAYKLGFGTGRGAFVYTNDDEVLIIIKSCVEVSKEDCAKSVLIGFVTD